MLRPGGFLAFVAEGAKPAAEADEGVVEEEKGHRHQGYDQIKGKVKFLVELSEVAREEWEGHVELVGIDLFVGHQHPLSEDGAYDQHNR